MIPDCKRKNHPADRGVLVGFSGGADSTAAALLLKEQGLTVTGLYLQTSSHPESQTAYQQAGQSAQALGIALIKEDVQSLFEREVIQSFCRDYAGGLTPNPCVICNPQVKFASLIQVADRLGIGSIATGHYAGIHTDGAGRRYIKKAADLKKDQSYMLYRLPRTLLNRLHLPLAELPSKEAVRALLRERGLPGWDRKDSQDICFIQEGGYADFLKERGWTHSGGFFVDSEGEKLGEHKGIIHYTVGQRKGLGRSFGQPLYVTAVDGRTKEVRLGREEELYARSVQLRDCFFVDSQEGGTLPRQWAHRPLRVRLRYAMKESPARLHQGEGKTVVVEFEKPQRAAAPGQSAVFYLGDLVLGGGIIC